MPRRNGSTADGGAAAVEFALLSLVFFPLVIGMISAGVAFSRQSNLTQAAREASRYGSTLSFQGAGGTLNDWLAQVAAAARAAGGDATDPMGGYEYSCVAYLGPGTQMRQEGTEPPEPGTCLPPNSALDPAYVQVVLRRDTDFNAIVFSPTITLTGSSVTPFEGAR
jgi:TadE-like protein